MDRNSVHCRNDWTSHTLDTLDTVFTYCYSKVTQSEQNQNPFRHLKTALDSWTALNIGFEKSLDFIEILNFLSRRMKL